MANKVQCTGGHWFDLSKFRFCPYCGLPAAVAVQAPVQPAPPVMPPAPPAPPMMPPMPPVQNGYYPQTQTIYPAPAPAPYAAPAPAPVAAVPAAKPPVGWLVGTSGPAKGKTYVIREGRNFVGSAPDMDIVLADDPDVSADRHAIIVYVPRLRSFFAQPGTSRELYYVNDQVVLETVGLNSGDVFEIGASKLSLLPLCGEQFGWNDEDAT